MSVKGDKMQTRPLNQFWVTSRLLSLLDAVNNRFEDSDDVLDYLLYYRFLSTASGVWLDIIGDIVGLIRPYTSRTDIFTYKSVGEANVATLAFGSVGGTGNGVYSTLSGGSLTTTRVDDTTYWALLAARIFTTYAEPTIPNIYLFIKAAFDNTESIITVPTPGNIEVELVTALTNNERRLLVELAPVAAGFDITITNWP